VTTATRRLRQAGVAFIAVAATAGGLALTATPAFADISTASAQSADSTPPTVSQGANGQTISDVQIAIPNTFNAGDFFTVTYGANACTTNTGNVSLVGTPKGTATGPFTAAFGSAAGTSTDTTPTFTIVEGSSSAGCAALGVKDQLTITLNNNNTNGGSDFYTLDISGLTANVGSTAATGALNTKVEETPSGDAYDPTDTTGTAEVTGSPVQVATIVNSTVSLTEVSAAPSATGIALNPITYSEITAGAFLPGGAATQVTLTLAGAGTPKFTAGVTPTITVPTGYSVTPAATALATTYNFTVTAPATAVKATIVIKGLTVDLTAAGTGVVTLKGSTAGVAQIGGKLAPAIGVLNQGRVGGIDRYATSAQLFGRGGFANASAVIASGQGFADGLSATYLASKLGTRTLLTNPVALQQSTTLALYNAGVATVYIVGGTAAVSDTVKNQISALHVSNNPANAFITVIRIAGSDRYQTNNAVDLYLGAGSSTNTAYVVNGAGFADALALAPAVYATGNPLVLTETGQLTAAAQSTLVNLGITKVIIVGGTAVVSAATETAIGKLSGVTVQNRIAGDDRTLTAAGIATYETTNGAGGIPASGSYVDVAGLNFAGKATVWLTNGQGFADALSAGAVAGGAGNPVLLTADANTVGAGIASFFAGQAATVTTVNAIGLTGALSVPTVNAAIATLS